MIALPIVPELRLSILVLSVGLSACASPELVVHSPGEAIAQLASGEVRLSCRLSCAGSYGAGRGYAKRLYDNALWRDLAIHVQAKGYEIDQAYFYLGRAAEGLGYREAALTYYRLARATTSTCGGALNVCDGLNIDTLTWQRRELVETTIKQTREAAAVSPSPQETRNAAAAVPTSPGEMRNAVAVSTSPNATPPQAQPATNQVPANIQGESSLERRPAETPVRIRNSESGPFGLRMAQSLRDVERLAALRPLGDSVYSASSLPGGHPEFDDYRMVVTPAHGLCKVTAWSRPISTSSYGDELRSRFERFLEPLQSKYGDYEKLDFLQSGSIWNERRDFMMGLVKKERHLVAYWTGKSTLPADISALALTVHAVSSSSGMISIAYEFRNFEDCSKWIKTRKDGSL